MRFPFLCLALRTGLDLRSLMRLVRITLTRRGTGESLYASKKPPERRLCGAYGARLAKLDEACPNNPDPMGHG